MTNPVSALAGRVIRRTHRGVTPDADIVKVIAFASVFIIIAIGLIGSLSYSITKNAAIRKLKNEDLLHIANEISSKIDGRIGRAQEAAMLLAADPQIQDWLVSGKAARAEQTKYVTTKLGALVNKFGYTNSFIVSAVDGRYWDETGRVIDTMSKTDPDDDWFYATLSARRPVSVSFDYNRERHATFVFINALVGDSQAPLGVAGVGLGLGGLSNEIRTFRSSNYIDLWLIDKDGNVYISDQMADEGANIGQVLPQNAKDELLRFTSQRSAAQHVLNYTSSSHVTMDLIIQPLRSTEWYLVLQLPRSYSIGFLNAIRLNTVLASLVILVFLTLLFFFLTTRLVNPYKRAMQLNRELEEKVAERTRELHEKNTKLMDSINYAQRIQQAILPRPGVLAQLFPASFLIWLPRDTVGGDFYWVKQLSQGYLVAVADCTGHGVPGALMSVISISILNRIVNQGEVRPAAILNQLHTLLQETLGQQDAKMVANDGLDIGLCHYNGNGALTFAGARTALYVKNHQRLTVVKGEQRGIGETRAKQSCCFTDTPVSWEDGDVFYLTTDGFIDQNGGLKDYSFGRKAFSALIDQHYEKPLSEQRRLFIEALEHYMGAAPQRDDITVLAFKIR